MEAFQCKGCQRDDEIIIHVKDEVLDILPLSLPFPDNVTFGVFLVAYVAKVGPRPELIEDELVPILDEHLTSPT